MKRRSMILAVSLALAAAQAVAREPKAPPSPTDPGARASTTLKPEAEDSSMNVFVGHFGETVQLAYIWAADAFMQGPMEVVNFHFAKIEPMKVVSPPFNPPKKEYVPENFARLRLMQMLVIPKDVPGGIESLNKLREAKAKELASSGIGYELLDLGMGTWPPDSFQVWVSTPYILFQAYTQSDKNLLIVTSGASPYDEHPADPILTNSTVQLLGSLSTYLDGFGRALRKPPSDREFVGNRTRVLMPGAVVCLSALLLFVLPFNSRRLSLTGKATFGLTGGWHLVTFPILYAGWRLGLDRWLNEASLIICAGLLTPVICGAAYLLLGGRRPWRLFLFAALASIFPTLLGWSILSDFASGRYTITGADNFYRLARVLGLLGLLNGIVFGLTRKEVSGQKAAS